jgi:hypothetical protein
VTGSVIYRRTQIAWPTIVPLLAVAAMLIPMFVRMELMPAVWITAGAYAVILLLFATLTVTVTTDGVDASFGIGVVSKSIAFADVVSFARTRLRWFNGWGIHSYPGGMLYNASGMSAIEFLLSSGRYVAIGTAEPEAFASAVQQATGKGEGTHDSTRTRAWGPQHTIGAIAGVFGVVVAGFAIYTTLQPPTTIVGFDSFFVGNGLYRNTVPYSSMRSVTLEETVPRIRLKTNGSGIGNIKRGNFLVDGWGASRLFINQDVPPFVVIQTADSHVVVNFTDPERTKRLYAELKAHAVRLSR